MKKCEYAAHKIINKCLGIQKNESVLILATEQQLKVAQLVQKYGLKKTKNTFLLSCPPILSNKEMHPSIGSLMKSVNVVIAATSPSISHTQARRNACRAGVRIASLPNITMETFCRIADCNFDKISQQSQKLADILSFAKKVHVVSQNGTDLIIPISKRKGYADRGILNVPGAFSNLPAGEASIAPDDGLCEGRLVVDSGMELIPGDKDTLIIDIKKGRAARITGGNAAKRLRTKLGKFGPNSRIVAEFGIGANSSAKICGSSLEDEKVLGTIHVALGNNVSFGGTNDVGIHLDGVVFNASVNIDGRQILKNGEYILT